MKSRGLCQMGHTGCTRQAALERQDLSGMYTAHLEPESDKVIVIVVVSMLSAGSLLQLLPSQQVNLSNLKTIPAICMLLTSAWSFHLKHGSRPGSVGR